MRYTLGLIIYQIRGIMHTYVNFMIISRNLISLQMNLHILDIIVGNRRNFIVKNFYEAPRNS